MKKEREPSDINLRDGLSARLTLLYEGRRCRPHMLSEAAFHLAVDAAVGAAPLEAGGEALLRDLVREQAPSLVVVDNLGKLKPTQADQVDLQVADQEDRAALAQIRSAVEGFDVEAVIVHHVGFTYAHELRREGHVDAVEQADTPDSPWMRAAVQAKSQEASA